MNKNIAELVGTFVLVFGGCGCAVLAGDKVGNVGITLGFGISLLAAAYAISPVSGCHINPARSIGPALFVGGWAFWQLWLFILVPVLGALAAARVYRAVRGQVITAGA